MAATRTDPFKIYPLALYSIALTAAFGARISWAEPMVTVGMAYRNQPTEEQTAKLIKLCQNSGYRGWYGIESGGARKSSSVRSCLRSISSERDEMIRFSTGCTIYDIQETLFDALSSDRAMNPRWPAAKKVT